MTILDINHDLPTLFRRQVEATPTAIAAEDGTVQWTYEELDSAADRVADWLRHSYGVGRDVLVGVLMGRSVQYIVACLAAVKAGGAFLVLEVAYPQRLLADVLEDAQPAVVITSQEYCHQVPSGVATVLLDDKAAIKGPDTTLAHAAIKPSPLPPPTDLDRLAFVSYSSGTTGRPKGIANPHSAAVRSYDLRFCFNNVQPGDRVACNVFFVWEILRPLLRGATVVTVPDETSYDPVGLVDFLAAHHVTETLMTPTLLATVLARYPTDLASRLPELRTLWLNGEVVTVDLARRALAALPRGARLLNCYSASETHEIACCDLASIFPTDATVCPAGQPLNPAHTYILDEDGHEVPAGTSGELFVGGGLLARGYLNRPETTAAVFLPDRFNTADSSGTARMYRTGDRARILPSGALEISGRVGGMIKLRGYTVQPAAVEAAIIKHLAVRSCVVLAIGDGLARQLVAYVVRDEIPIGGMEDRPGDPRSRARLDIDAEGRSPLARRLLAGHLAHYMVPALWVPLEVLPTHKVSGKIDVKGLPQPRFGLTPPETPHDGASVVGDDVGSATHSSKSPLVAELRGHWAACLGLDVSTVTTEYDFFDLGGHSLALAALASRLSHAYEVILPLVELVRTPTLDGHAKLLQAARAQCALSDPKESILAAMKADSVLPDDIRALPAQTRNRMAPLNDADCILLTGATGFLGASLLDALIAKTSGMICCLVRTTHESPSGMARLRRHLLELGLWHDEMADRIEIVSGDLSQPRLGLTPLEFDHLAARVQVIMHAGANVNLVYPYNALRDANVGGTCELLRLASSRTGNPATVHYISTNGVLPTSTTAWAEDANIDVEAAASQLVDGYCQTKWVSEKLIRQAANQGIPTCIYRPGTLGGHSRSGASNPRDVLSALIIESVQLGYTPPLENPSDGAWMIEMTPVDFASDAIVALANGTENSADGSTIFHIGDPTGLPAKDLFERLATLGYPTLPTASLDEWVTLWTTRQEAAGSVTSAISTSRDDPSPADILRSGMPTADFFRAVTLLADTRTHPLLAKCSEEKPIVRHGLELSLLRTYMRHFYSRGWLNKCPEKLAVTKASGIPTAQPQKKPLAGRVAVVVGASSGIGAAIATALVRDGAHVALAARRVDALKGLAQKLEEVDASDGTRVMVQATDVTILTQVSALMEAAKTQLGGPVDILVICAGVMYFTMMTSVRTDEWERTVDVNCKGLLHCLAATVPEMTARGHGHIVAISSDAGRKVFPGLGVYSGSKFFVEAVLQSLRLETAGSGLRVTSVQPGNTATDLLSLSTDPEAMEKYGTPTGAKVLDPEDVAGAVVYALRQPEHVAVNEVLIEPREEPI